MNKILLILFFLFPLIGISQNYPLAKEGGIWRSINTHYEPGEPPPNTYSLKFQYYMIGDTLFNQYHYFKVYATNYDSIISNLTLIGLMRNDVHGKVYYRDLTNSLIVGTNEIMLYDFSLTVGDTFFVPTSNKYHIVRKVDSINIEGNYRKKITLEDYFYLLLFNPRTWIDGIGDIHGLFYPIEWDFESSTYLTCYEDSLIFWNNIYYGNSNYGQSYDCFTVGVNKNEDNATKRNNYSIYPNPVSKSFAIKGVAINNPIRIEVYDLRGRIVINKKYESGDKLYVNNLSKGLYIYRIFSDNKVFCGKFMVAENR